MLFNSYGFIFLFLPLFIGCWQFSIPAASQNSSFRRELLFLLFSLLFYAFWGVQYLLLLIFLIVANYLLAVRYISPHSWRQAEESKDGLSRKTWFIIAIAINLAPLLWFKYSWFFIRNLALLFGFDWLFTPPGLPLGISFYTFIQIAWLTGVYRGQFQPDTLYRHATFSCSFPYVISGPIVRFEQMNGQLAKLTPSGSDSLAMGVTLFGIGLVKKVLLADSIGIYADSVFSAAEKGWPLAGAEAWLGSLCYTFQLYFDFSGYTDMAIGLGLMIGLRLPENFNAPYRATGILEFWRRWHITLGAWLRDFVYIPLGGNRKGKFRQHLNLFLVMLICGAWHGAGWTFILWGALQGLMLCINHLFRASVRDTDIERYLTRFPVRLFLILLTFLCINLCWVVFRAFSLDGALAMYSAMFGEFFLTDGAMAQNAFLALFPNHYFTNWQPFALVAVSMLVCWVLPTSRQFILGEAFLRWQMTSLWAFGLGVLSFVALLLLNRQTVFLYFQF